MSVVRILFERRRSNESIANTPRKYVPENNLKKILYIIFITAHFLRQTNTRL